ncbi:MAG: protein phosphatase [Frankiales bacterium]|nr:protein phosphatase [Frankiales bacterium]
MVRRLDIALEPVSVGRARRFVAECLAAWDVTDPDGVAPLVVSELVTNALRHGRGFVTLVVGRRLDRIVLSVMDGSREVAEPGFAGPLEEAGRGLHLVETLSLAWGSQVLPEGKRVWAEVPRTESDSGEDRALG